jgi:hypothetical protein
VPLLLFAVTTLVLIAAPISATDAGPANANGNGTEDAPYVVSRTESEIDVDGVLDESAWENALVLELDYEVQPGENITPPVRTEVLLTYDESHLYAGFRCYDPDPSAICANLSDRDNISSGDDWVGLVLDTFNDQRRSFDLLVNPCGVQEDFIESETGGASWDAIWESAGKITDWGYAIELAVPFNQLRFQRADTPQMWGFDAVRSYPRSERHHIGVFPRDRSNNCYLCQAVKIRGFGGVSPGKNVEITPTLTGSRSEVRPEFPEGDLEVDDEEVDAGVTGRWGITPNLTLMGTVNPDFSQVEADVIQLDINNPYALYYSERRPFFLEGADFFGMLKSAIYTRTIRDPLWGAKISGKEGGSTIGAFVVGDELTGLIFPMSTRSDAAILDMKSTASVLRYKRDVRSSSAVGLLFTDREGDDYYNRLLGVDCDLRFTQKDQIQLQLMTSSTSYPDDVVEDYDQPEGKFSDEFIAFEYDHSSRNVYWWFDYDQVGKDFRADLGFIPRVGFRNAEGGVSFNFYPEESGWWSRFQAGTEYNYYEDDDGVLLDRGGNIWFTYIGPRQSDSHISLSRYTEAYGGEEFDLTSYHICGSLRPVSNLNIHPWINWGDRIDYDNTRPGDHINTGLYVTCNVTRHLRLELDHAYEHLDVDAGRLYTANRTYLAMIYQFNVRTMLRSILQYVNYDFEPERYMFPVDPEYKHLFTQFLFSYEVNPRTVLYLGYSDDHLGDQDIDLTQANRTFFTKIGYAWVR